MRQDSTKQKPTFDFERDLHSQAFQQVCGVDEVGRGPLAGPVIAAAVILPTGLVEEGLFDHLNDSKKLSATKRAEAASLIRDTCSFAIAEANVEEIDDINILWASMRAMSRAIDALPVQADFALIDGNRCPATNVKCQALVKGDSRSLSIAAASILAKEFRDQLMCSLDQDYPMYGWQKNMGYPTKMHRDALQEHGPSPHHRRTFGSLKNSMR